MSLEELKNKWKYLDVEKSNSSSLNKRNLQMITAKKYKHNFTRILIPELLLSTIYLFGLIFFIAFFYFFNSSLHIMLASVAIFLLIAIPTISLYSFIQYFKAGKMNTTLDKTVHLLKQKGQQFIRKQYLLSILNILLLVICVVLVPMVYAENPSNKSMIFATIIGGSIILLISSRIWKYYKKKIASIEQLAQSLV